jgi:hypothetical protein
MRALQFVTFGAVTAMLTLTACAQAVTGSATDDVTSKNDDAGAPGPGFAPGSSSTSSEPREITAAKKPIFEGVSDSGAGEDADLDAQTSACGSGAGELDESQLSSNGNMVVSVSQSAGQTFTAVGTGILTGIELGLSSCNGVDPAANIVLTLSRGETVLGSASISASSIGSSACGGIPLSRSEIGSGYFDLSSDCIAIASGDHLSVTLTISGSTASCSSFSHQCIGGSNDGFECESDDDCQYAARLGIQSSDEYDAGAMFVNGSSTGWDASFKTFVR